MFEISKTTGKPVPERAAESELNIEITDNGFAVVRSGMRCFGLDWGDVWEIFAFNEALGSAQRVCLGFRFSDACEYYRVDQEEAGFSRMVSEIEQRYPDYNNEWWAQVTAPPASFNYTVVWSRPP